MSELTPHSTVLTDGDLVLRPMTEADWGLLMSWANDPDVLWFSEGERVGNRPLREWQAIYRGVSRTPADLFIFELDGEPVGDGWLQHMNLRRLLEAFPELDCRRIDLQLGKAWWGRGLGTRAIRLLTAYGFQDGADLIFGVDIAADNQRSRQAFLSNRYVPWRRLAQPDGAKTRMRLDLICRPEYFFGRIAVKDHPGVDKVMAGDGPGGASVLVYRRLPQLEVLMLHRAHHGPDYEGDWAWTSPAGARFPAEPILGCACRELHEEIGLDLQPAQLCLAVPSDAWVVYSHEVGPDFTPTLDEEHDRHEWLSPADALARSAPEPVRSGLAAALRTVSNAL